MKIDRREQVGRADLRYKGCAAQKEGGLPIGNGTMGSMVWTSPSAIKFQINRVDVFAANSTTNSFNRRHSDYGYACGFLDIDFADYGEDVFGKDTRQYLGLYDAEASVEGNGVRARIFAEAEQDVFVINVEDFRENAESVKVRLQMMRPAEFRTLGNLAVSRLSAPEGGMLLKQKFTEDSYYCASAVYVWVEGRDYKIRMNDENGGRGQAENPYRETSVLGQPQETQMRLCLAPGKGSFTVYAVSAASFDRTEDIGETALKKAAAVKQAGRNELFRRHTKWWHSFWSQSYVNLSGNRTAETIEIHYTYFFYLMASCSRGVYPPNFGGMLFSPGGDFRHWGTMQWWNNLSLYYYALPAAGYWELMQPLFSQYFGMKEAAETAAGQQWGSKGMYLPEVTWFNGPEKLPDEIAEEMRDLYLFRKPWAERSEAFLEFVDRKPPHESRYNYKSYEHYEKGRVTYQERGFGPYGATTYMFGSQVGIAWMFWTYYTYTNDLQFLREKAYPIIKGAAEFFMNLELVQKAEDGYYHIYRTCTDESYYGCTDGMENVAGMHAIFAILLKAAQILGEDRDSLEKWKEFQAHLAPLPTTDREDAFFRTGKGEAVLWSCGREPLLAYDKGTPSLYPCDHFDLSSCATEDTAPGRYRISRNTLIHRRDTYGLTSRYVVSEMSGCARMYAAHGFAEEFEKVADAQLRCVNAAQEYCYYNDTGRIPYFENRLTVREGVNCISAQRLGNVAAAVQLALCQSSGGGPGEDPVIKVFAAVPPDWDVEFSLWCRGGVRVTGTMRRREIAELSLYVRDGGEVRLYCPYQGKAARVTCGEHTVYEGKDPVIRFAAEAGTSYQVEVV